MTQYQSKSSKLGKALNNLKELRRVIYKDLQEHTADNAEIKQAIVDVYYTLAQLEEIYNIDLTLNSTSEDLK